MIGVTYSTVVVIKVQVQDTDIIKEVVVHGARGAPPMDGAWGSDGIRYCVHINMCKTWVGGDVRWFLVPIFIINLIGEFGRINRRLIGIISGVVLDNCRDLIDFGINIVHKLFF